MPLKRGTDLALRIGAAAYSAYRARNSVGSVTQTMRQNRNLPVLVEAGEYTKKSRKAGRYKKKTLRNVYRILATNQQAAWYRFSGKNRFNSGGGFYGLPNHLQTTATPVEFLPCYFMELTGVPNFNGTLINPFPFWFLNRTNSAAQSYQLIQTNGQNESGGAFGQWYFENSGGSSSYPGRAAIHKYSDIRMMLYGATATPIKYDISIVSFPDDEYNPFNGQTMTTSSTFSVGGLSQVLLDSLMSPYASNPINIQDPKMREKIKYHFRENFIIQPGSTTDGDAGVPHFRELRIFRKWDQVHRFDWGDFDRVDPQVPPAFQQNLTSVYSVPNYRYRKYLMIRATSAYTSSGVPPLIDTSKNGTFDMLVRNKWEMSYG